MKYKAKVLKRFPQAKPVIVTRAHDGSPHHIAIYVDGSPLDIYDDENRQLHNTAWLSAYYWCVRNPTQEPG